MTRIKKTLDLYQIGRIERFPLRTPYTAVVERVTELVRRCGSAVELVVDATGVGQPVVDMFRACGVSPIAVTRSRDRRTRRWHRSHGAQELLISRLDALMATARLKIQADLPEAEVLISELKDYQVQFNPIGAIDRERPAGKAR